tara:strand:- start:1270 stop:1458 length:189 start_codon:yes stop_codon:yes gene_type:complete
MSWIVKRDYTEDGVVGLNGDQYLLTDNGDLMEFQKREEAVSFLVDVGIDLTVDDGITIEQKQ